MKSATGSVVVRLHEVMAENERLKEQLKQTILQWRDDRIQHRKEMRSIKEARARQSESAGRGHH